MEFERALPLMSTGAVKAPLAGGVGGAAVCSTGELSLAVITVKVGREMSILTDTYVLLSKRKNLKMKGK